MTNTQPSITDVLDALPSGVEGDANERAPSKHELQVMLEDMQSRPIPTGRIRRMWSVGTLQAKIGAAYVAWWLRSGFQDAETKRKGLDETHVSASIQVLGRMNYMRGAVMKLGQILAHWPNVLPGSFAEVMGRLYAEAPPMHFALLREFVRDELGDDPTELFDEFETTAFAAASLGQVHRARLKPSGAAVAVKVQYPNIGRTIKEDIKNLKLSAFGMRFSGDWQNLLLQYEGIQAMFEKEIDYRQEVEFQKACRSALSGMDEVVVPEVYEAHSTDRVITMEYLDGLHLDEFMATNPSQELCDHFGALIARATLRLWYHERLVYADPHPGNFLFLPDGRLGMLDFGCCHRFSDDEFDYVMEIEGAAFDGDEVALRAAMAKGCDLGPDEISDGRAELMKRYTDWTWGPIMQSGPFDFGTPDQFAEGVKIYGEFIKRRYVRSQPVNVWLTKLFFGVRAMLTRLNARVAYGDILRSETVLERD